MQPVIRPSLKSRKVRLAGHVQRIGYIRNKYKFNVKLPEVSDYFKGLREVA